MSQSTRAYLYRIAAAAVPIVVALGFLTVEMSGLVMGLVGALLIVAEPPLITAARNTPTKTE
jgi:hypothetical protein